MNFFRILTKSGLEKPVAVGFDNLENDIVLVEEDLNSDPFGNQGY